MSQQLTLAPQNQIEVARQIDGIIQAFNSSKDKNPFALAINKSSALQQISELLTEEYMAPIMFLQNKAIGFKTDNPTGYRMEVVRDCLMEATFYGFEPTGNQFNIISGRAYGTKEGFTALLRKMGVSTRIYKKIGENSGGYCKVTCEMQWGYGKLDQKATEDFSVKVNSGMGHDAILGKAERKAKCWIYNDITGNNITDADVTEDIPHEVVSSKTPLKEVVIDAEIQRAIDHLKGAKTIEDLEKRDAAVKRKYPDGFPEVYNEIKFKL